MASWTHPRHGSLEIAILIALLIGLLVTLALLVELARGFQTGF